MAILIPVFLSSCSKDDESSEQTFYVNVYTQWEDGDEEISNQALVYIFAKENKNIDTSKSAESVVDDGVITYTDGTKSSKPKYATKYQVGVFNIENFPNGEYILWVTHMNEYGGACYSSSKNISVNENFKGASEKKVFKQGWSDRGMYFYQNW